MPRLSIVIPTYNRAWCIRRAINSALWQSFEDFELIIVDDGSTDDTQSVLGTYRDKRIHILQHQKNKGASAAINTGIRASKGDYIAILDSDDEWLPEKMERQIAVMDADEPDVGVVYSDMWKFRGSKREYYHAPHIVPTDGIIYERALDDALSNIGNPLMLFRRECFNRVGLFDEKLPRQIDLDIAIRISKYFKFHHIPEALGNYYASEVSITAGGEAAGISAIERMVAKQIDEYLANKPLFAKRMYWIGSSCMRSGQTDKGRQYLRSALTYSVRPRYIGAFLLSFAGHKAYGSVHRFLQSQKLNQSIELEKIENPKAHESERDVPSKIRAAS